MIVMMYKGYRIKTMVRVVKRARKRFGFNYDVYKCTVVITKNRGFIIEKFTLYTKSHTLGQLRARQRIDAYES